MATQIGKYDLVMLDAHNSATLGYDDLPQSGVQALQYAGEWIGFVPDNLGAQEALEWACQRIADEAGVEPGQVEPVHSPDLSTGTQHRYEFRVRP